MSELPILTTPPVHDAGPDFGQNEIEGGEVAKTGVDSRLRAAFEDAVTKAAAKVSIPVVAPVKQLIAATFAVIKDLPRVPDYDHVSASQATWSEAFDYSPTEVPDADPDSIGVFVRDQGPDMGKVCIELTSPVNDDTTTLDFDPAYIKHFFLAGLAACAYAEAQVRK